MRNLLLALLIVTLMPMSYADRGSIPFNPIVQIREPNQRALIAFNGKEEILILSTDLQASEATKILEVIPLPSEPVVTKGDIKIFQRATDILNAHLRTMHNDKSGRRSSGGAMSGGLAEARNAGKLTFHKQIGAHEISTVQVQNREYFVEWVEKYLKSLGVDTPKIPEQLKNTIDEYIADNYRWFVFDVVSLGAELQTMDPIQYRFDTGFLYYPLRISRTDHGHTNIRLMILSEKLFSQSQCLGLDIQRIRMVHEPVTLSSAEVRKIDNNIYTMLGQPQSIKIRHWQIYGELSSFDADVIYGDFVAYHSHIGNLNRLPARK